jgi:hypothetical protein
MRKNVKLGEGYDTLSDTMNVDGVDGIMEVLGRAVFPEEVIEVEGEPPVDGCIKFSSLSVFSNAT